MNEYIKQHVITFLGKVSKNPNCYKYSCGKSQEWAILGDKTLGFGTTADPANPANLPEDGLI